MKRKKKKEKGNHAPALLFIGVKNNNFSFLLSVQCIFLFFACYGKDFCLKEKRKRKKDRDDMKKFTS